MEQDGQPFTIQKDALALQLNYLKEHNYNSISLSQLVDFKMKQIMLPPKPVLLSFDDGYKSVLTILYPLLQSFNIKASVFVVPSWINNTEPVDPRYLFLEDLKKIPTHIIEWGIHSYDHKNFKRLNSKRIKEDIKSCINWFNVNNIPFVYAFAFPFGAYPKYNPYKNYIFFKALANTGIKLSFRIGNRMNYLRNKRTLMLQRIDIKGNETISDFDKYLREGKRKTLRQILFSILNNKTSFMVIFKNAFKLNNDTDRPY